MDRRLFTASFALFTLASACGRSAPFSSAGDVAPPANPVVVLENGPNALDLLGDGTRGQVFVAWRGNYNAHGHSEATFYLFAKSDLGNGRRIWQLVPFFGDSRDSTASRAAYGTTEGADCTLGDLRVVRRERRPIEVVIAVRDFQLSYADSEAVHFDYYELTKNADGMVGRPPYYFQYSRTVRAKHPYCDVNTAFDRELGLGVAGIGHGEGGR